MEALPVFFYYIIAMLTYILGPIIPAVIMHRVAPNAPITASGVLHNVTFKAGGAFASYVIVLMICGAFIPSVLRYIDQEAEKFTPDYNWKIKGNIKFKDYDTGKELNELESQDFLKLLSVYIDPKLSKVNSNLLIANIPNSFIDQFEANLLFKIDQENVVLTNPPIVLKGISEDQVDYDARSIDLKDIYLTFSKVTRPEGVNIQDQGNAQTSTKASPPPPGAKALSKDQRPTGI